MKSRVLDLFLAIVLFVSVLVSFSSNGRCNLEEGESTLFVGGSGFGNYSVIQDAVNASFSGDTIIVYEGIYYENLVLNKSITLIGLDRFNTIIDGDGFDDVVVVSAKGVCISNFTIRNSGDNNAGIIIEADNFSIEESIIVDNGWCGVKTGDNCKNCTITSNIIEDNGYGVFFNEITFNIDVNQNIISNNTWDGIYLDYSNDGIVTENIIEYNGDDGIGLSYCDNVNIDWNTVQGNGDNGLYLYSCETTIEENTISSNAESGIFLRNSNYSNIEFNNISNNNNGVDLTFLSTGNKISYNNITRNIFGIYVSSEAGSNSYSDNIFLENNEDIIQVEAKTPGFEIMLIFSSASLLVIIFKLQYKAI